MGRRCGATPFMVLLASFSTLLHRYTGQEDLVLGIPVSGRGPVETEKLIGVFINTLPFRIDLSGDSTFIDLLQRTRETCVGAYAHQDLPFEKIVEHMKPARDPGRSPLFQAMLNVKNLPDTPYDGTDLLIEEIELPTRVALFDLTLELVKNGETFAGSLIYNKDIFDESTVLRMTGHFRTLLEGAVANPEESLSRLPLLTPAERRRLLVEWNDTRTDYPKDACIHHLFEAQAERTPDAVAVVSEDRRLTYRELNARANQLAHYLRRRGVGPDVLVGICMERSLEMVVGLLGILKAGGAYVPLDPTYPKERLEFMLRDANPAVLLTQSALQQKVPLEAAEIVKLDADWAAGPVEGKAVGSPLTNPAAVNLAYVIFTSGSTGSPKGVQVAHRSVVNFLTSMKQILGVTEQDVFSAIATISFDISVLEIFLPLSIGAKLVLLNRDTATDGPLLCGAIDKFNPTVIQATPSTWQLLLEAGWKNKKTMALCGGESLPQELLAGLLECAGRAWNLYGPTETTIHSTCCASLNYDGPISIGRPIANTRIYLLDSHLQPVPIGVTGELYIGGDGLARGYLNRPRLTQERFVPDCFRAASGARMYRTGDLARYRPDGNIEFLGRIDHQVKIRGFRIELGEIESTLGQHHSIRHAAVVAREDAPGDKRLVAYVVPRPGATAFAAGELRRFLQQKLPDYMIPAVFIALDAMPLAPAGKGDRHALPAPDRARPQLEKSYATPRTPIEEALAGIWTRVLGLDEIG
ncbi:amino acid adenylation domain-containing protein, partial [bacterium]